MDVLAAITPEQVGACITPRFQELILLPTEKCNFRCTYCYEDFALGRMPEAVQAGIESLILERAPQLQKLVLSWFGGEPLLASGVVLRISRYAQALSAEHGFVLKGGLTTNGYLLTPALARELIACKQDFYQISLDGWGEVHDQTRQRADGKGTFGQIWSNLLELRRLSEDFDCLLRLHLTGLNHESMRELCRQIHAEFGNDTRFRTNFQDVKNLGGAGGKTVIHLEPRGYEERVRDLTSALVGEAHAGTIFARPDAPPASESASRQRADEASDSDQYICYAAKPNSLLIRADGRIGKCTVALNDPRNDLGRINADGTISFNSKKLMPWIRGLASHKSEELSCPLDGLSMPVEAEPGGTTKVSVNKAIPVALTN